MFFVLVSRSRRVVPDELVTLTSWDARDFLIFLVMPGWKGKDAVKDGVVAFCCLLNCLRVSNSLLGFFSFCLTLSMMRLTLSGGVHFVRRLCRLCPVQFWSVHVNLVQNPASFRTISFISNWMCFLWRYTYSISTRQF